MKSDCSRTYRSHCVGIICGPVTKSEIFNGGNFADIHQHQASRDVSLIEELVIEFCVCGNHIYNNVAVVVEELSCAYEARNMKDMV